MSQPPTHHLQRSAKCVLFGISMILLVPVVLIPWVDHQARSRGENRTLTPFPSFTPQSLKGSYQEELTGYLNDHIAFAYPSSKTVKSIQYHVFGTCTDPRIHVSREKTPLLIHRINPSKGEWGSFSAIHQLLHSEEAQARVTARMKALQQVAEARQVKIMYLIPPTKPTLYQEELKPFMPEAYYESSNLTARAEAFSLHLESIQSDSFTLLYPVSEFMEHREDPSFYPKMNFHFQGASVALATQLLLGIEPPTLSEQKIMDRSDLRRMLGFPLEGTLYTAPESENYRLYRFGKTIGARIDPAYFNLVTDIVGENWVGGIAQFPQDSDATYTLLLGDSFSNNLFPVLSAYEGNVLHLCSNQLNREELEEIATRLFAAFDITKIVFTYRDTILGRMKNTNMHTEEAILQVLSSPKVSQAPSRGPSQVLSSHRTVQKN